MDWIFGTDELAAYAAPIQQVEEEPFLLHRGRPGGRTGPGPGRPGGSPVAGRRGAGAPQNRAPDVAPGGRAPEAPWASVAKTQRVAGVAYAGQHQQNNIGTGYGLSLDHRLHRLAGQTRHSAGGAAPPGRVPVVLRAQAPGLAADPPGAEPGRPFRAAAAHSRCHQTPHEGRYRAKQSRPPDFPVCPGGGGGHGPADFCGGALRPGYHHLWARRPHGDFRPERRSPLCPGPVLRGGLRRGPGRLGLQFQVCPAGRHQGRGPDDQLRAVPGAGAGAGGDAGRFLQHGGHRHGPEPLPLYPGAAPGLHHFFHQCGGGDQENPLRSARRRKTS